MRFLCFFRIMSVIVYKIPYLILSEHFMCHPERSVSGVELLRVEPYWRASKSARRSRSGISFEIPISFIVKVTFDVEGH